MHLLSVQTMIRSLAVSSYFQFVSSCFTAAPLLFYVTFSSLQHISLYLRINTSLGFLLGLVNKASSDKIFPSFVPLRCEVNWQNRKFTLWKVYLHWKIPISIGKFQSYDSIFYHCHNSHFGKERLCCLSSNISQPSLA